MFYKFQGLYGDYQCQQKFVIFKEDFVNVRDARAIEEWDSRYGNI